MLHEFRPRGHNRTVTHARTINLRRPPVLVTLGGRFVPSAVALAEVDARWQALSAENPRFFDGSLLQVLGSSRNGHGGVSLHVQECSYRFYAVQKTGLDCGVRPLGVKGICVIRDAPLAPRVLMGRRSASVAFYPRQWEFVPGGGVEAGVEPAIQVVRELAEEAKLQSHSTPIAIALLYDPCAFTWEIVHSIEIESTAVPELGWEYDEFMLASLDALPQPLAPVALQMLPLARRVINRM